MKILILENNPERIELFTSALKELQPECEVIVWKSAHRMIDELDRYLGDATAISLAHDLDPALSHSAAPGTGMDVIDFLTEEKPSCPIILHTANMNARWNMVYTLTDANWAVHLTPPFGDNHDWIQKSWLTKIKDVLQLESVEAKSQADLTSR